MIGDLILETTGDPSTPERLRNGARTSTGSARLRWPACISRPSTPPPLSQPTLEDHHMGHATRSSLVMHARPAPRAGTRAGKEIPAGSASSARRTEPRRISPTASFPTAVPPPATLRSARHRLRGTTTSVPRRRHHRATTVLGRPATMRVPEDPSMTSTASPSAVPAAAPTARTSASAAPTTCGPTAVMSPPAS